MPIKVHRASDYLKTPEDIVAYLNAAIEDMEDDPRLLMKAFRNVAEAQGGISALARQSGLDRVALSRALSGRRNPRLDTLAKVTDACGVKLRFSMQNRTRRQPARPPHSVARQSCLEPLHKTSA